MGKGKKGVRKGRGAGSGPGPSSSNNKGEERAARKDAKKQRQKGKRFGDKEEREYEAQLAAIGGTIQHMASDGNCLFRSIYDQLEGKPEKHMECRLRLVKYMEAHPDDFSPFMEDDEKWDDYVPRMKTEREWGGQLEIVAASRLFQVNVVVHQLNAPRLEVHADDAKRTIHLSYHGESHYNSVRSVTDPCRPGEPAQQWAGVASTAPPPAPPPAAKGNWKKGKGANGGKRQTNGYEQGAEGGTDDGGESGEGDGSEAATAAAGADGEQPGAEDGAGGEGGEEEDGAAGATTAAEGQEAEAQPHGEEEEGDAAADDAKEATTAKVVGGQCPCGSGRKYRKCCRKADRQRHRGAGAVGRKPGGSDEEEGREEAPAARHAASKKKKPPATTAAATAATGAGDDGDASVNAVAARLQAIAM